MPKHENVNNLNLNLRFIHQIKCCKNFKTRRVRISISSNTDPHYSTQTPSLLWAVWRIQKVLMQIRIPLFKRIRIQIFLPREIKKFLQNLHLFFPQSYQTLLSNFLSNNAGGRWWVRDKGQGMRKEGWGVEVVGRWKKGEEAEMRRVRELGVREDER